MENPPFWWHLPGKMGIFHGYLSLTKGKPVHWLINIYLTQFGKIQSSSVRNVFRWACISANRVRATTCQSQLQRTASANALDFYCTGTWVFPKIRVPQNGWFIMENPIKMGDLGIALFSETSTLTFWHTTTGSNDFALPCALIYLCTWAFFLMLCHLILYCREMCLIRTT